MASSNNRLSQPITFHRKVVGGRYGKTFLRGVQQRAAKLNKPRRITHGKFCR